MTSDAAQVMQLGREIADALDPSDVVGRWMSHHLADLLTKSEAQPEDDELAAQAQELVLRLWEHKAGGRFRRAPLEYLQPVFAALGRLEPDPPPWAHYRALSSEDRPTDQELTSYPLLQAACDMDHEFGQLVRIAVALAAEEAIASEEPWVMAGAALGNTLTDEAIQQVQQLVRSYQQLAAQYSTGFDSEDELVMSDISGQNLGFASSSDGDCAATRSKNDVLHMSMRAAIAQCSSLLERINELTALDSPADFAAGKPHDEVS